MAKKLQAIQSLLLFAGLAAAQLPTAPQIPAFAPPGPDDVRGPCPGLNTLSNHFLLPHNGKDITQEMLVQAMLIGTSQDESISVPLFTIAARSNPAPNPDVSSFSLPDLGRHNIIEHDASLSRIDAHFGNQIPFNQTVFDQTLTVWTEDTINITTAAAGRALQIRNSQATNPEYGLSLLAQGFTTGETIAPILVFGDKTTGVAPKDPIVYWFENEQFPAGYTPPVGNVSMMDLQFLSRQLGQALTDMGIDLTAGPSAPAMPPRLRSVHAGWL